MTLKDKLKRNDILVESFGYNMTLYDFYRVVKIVGSKVVLLPLEKTSTGWTGFMQCEVKPIVKAGYLTKNLINKRFNKMGGITIDNNNLFLYDKTRQYVENHAD